MYKKFIILYLFTVLFVGKAVGDDNLSYHSPWCKDRIEIGYDPNKLSLFDQSEIDTAKVKKASIQEKEQENETDEAEAFLNIVMKYIIGIIVIYIGTMVILGASAILSYLFLPLIRKVVYHKIPKEC